MKLLSRVVLAIFVLAAVFIAFAYMRASSARDVDRAYHAAIPKTVILQSISFSAGGDIPSSYTCKGEGVSPELSWEDAPDKKPNPTFTVATDWDGPAPRLRLGNFTHWILYNIPRDVHEIKSAPREWRNSLRKIEVGHNSSVRALMCAPCPPGKHRYIFRLYALDVPQIHPPRRDRDGVMDAMTIHVLAYGEMVGLFGG